MIGGRGRFVAGLALALTATAMVGDLIPAGAATPAGPTASSPTTPIRHVVTVMQEGHTFDNYFGSFPGADGIPANTCMPVSPPVLKPCVKPFRLGARPLRDLARGAGAFARAEAGGAMNGFVSAESRNGVVEDQAMGTYDRSTVPYYWNVAKQNVLFDRFFASAPGGSLPNHLAWVSGTTTGATGERVPDNGFGDLPTIFDQLEARGISWKFYVQNYDPTVTFRRERGAVRGGQVVRVPLLAYRRYVDDPKLFAHIVPVSQYFEDLESGSLPAVSYIVPSGPSERSPTNVTSGARFVQSLVGALSGSSSWSTSAFLLTYDGWGGYYDHVVPTATGFRVPTLLVSPYARRGVVDHTRLSTASVPELIAENWGLDPVAPGAGNLMSAFDFKHPARPARVINATAPEATVATAQTGVVFLLYGLAFAGALAVLGTVSWRARRRNAVRRNAVVVP